MTHVTYVASNWRDPDYPDPTHLELTYRPARVPGASHPGLELALQVRDGEDTGVDVKLVFTLSPSDLGRLTAFGLQLTGVPEETVAEYVRHVNRVVDAPVESTERVPEPTPAEKLDRLVRAFREVLGDV
jgi:hypothetical protein